MTAFPCPLFHPYFHFVFCIMWTKSWYVHSTLTILVRNYLFSRAWEAGGGASSVRGRDRPRLPSRTTKAAALSNVKMTTPDRQKSRKGGRKKGTHTHTRTHTHTVIVHDESLEISNKGHSAQLWEKKLNQEILPFWKEIERIVIHFLQHFDWAATNYPIVKMNCWSTIYYNSEKDTLLPQYIPIQIFWSFPPHSRSV